MAIFEQPKPRWKALIWTLGTVPVPRQDVMEELGYKYVWQLEADVGKARAAGIRLSMRKSQENGTMLWLRSPADIDRAAQILGEVV